MESTKHSPELAAAEQPMNAEAFELIPHVGDKLILDKNLIFSIGENGEFVGTDPVSHNQFVTERPTENSEEQYPVIVTRVEEIAEGAQDGAHRIYVKFASPEEMYG